MAHRSIRGRPPTYIPALEDIANDDHPYVVVQKSAQIGVTELMVSQSLWAADVGFAGRGNVLYLMPTQGQMGDFSQARFDMAIAESPYLSSLVRPEPPSRKGANSMRLKWIGNGYIYLRGSDSPRAIASVDADLVILDEYDQMHDGTLVLAQKRLASSENGRIRVVSTPRFSGVGINELFLASDMRYYFIPCLHCGLDQKLTFDDNVCKKLRELVCKKCREPIKGIAKGKWIASAPDEKKIRGYHLNRLYSPWLNIGALIDSSEATSTLEVQEFYNSDLGEVYNPPGGGLTPIELDKCRSNYSVEDYSGQPCVMGIDVGNSLHVVIREDTRKPIRKPESRLPAPELSGKLWFADTVASFEELDRLCEKFNVVSAVIDALPETRLSKSFAERHSFASIAHYRDTDVDHKFDKATPDKTRSVTLNRTLAMDGCVDRFRTHEIQLPMNARELGGRVRKNQGEYYRQMLASKRVLVESGHGDIRARWNEGSAADDFAQAEVYCFIAQVQRNRGARIHYSRTLP